MNYDLELEKVAEEIKKNKAKTVCIQLPDGLKPEATNIVNELKQKTEAEIIIWAGDCYGACDTPLGLKEMKIDLLIQFGHSVWPFY
jgi:2-(3-amino-3-carboxypropyl)histidine synthase